jgi:uncharacterized UPF0160 family protein
MEYAKISSILSIISLVSMFVFSVISVWRASKKDAQESTKDITVINEKLDQLITTVSEIKTDNRTMKEDIKDHEGRIIILEQKQDTAWKKIDELREKIS